MHELHIATEIITIVQEEMATRRLSEVKAVGIRLGVLSGVDPEALTFGFEAATIDTPQSGAKLIIERIPVQGRCRSCKKDFQVEEFIFMCPHCCSTDMEITQGEELDVAYLVGE